MGRGKKQEIICACGCGRKKMVRTADVKRGWGKYFSKSCKAIKQVRRIGRPKFRAMHEDEDDLDMAYMHPQEDDNFTGEH